ncbi:MAG: nitronate monooxygenase [Anaerolineae bacterium]|nr:nitronate monooxygenase [Anaerolineae bacterium]
MWYQTILTKMVGSTYPIIQAPMAGGPSTPELVAAVSNGGGLGSLGAGYMTPAQMQTAIRAVRSLTHRPFAVNVFVLEPVTATPAQVDASRRYMQPYRDALGVAAPDNDPHFTPQLDELMAIILEERVPVVSFTFGVPPAKWVQALKAAGVPVIGTATSVAEGLAMAQAGADAVVGQGAEAGAHRGGFAHLPEVEAVGTIALIPQLVDHLSVPVIAAGGIMDGRGLAAALALGAAGVQMGTAFLTCPESGAHPLHKAALRDSIDTSTTVTRAFSGKAARGITNQFILEMIPHQAELPPYPVQNSLTGSIRRAAAQQERPEFMSLWAGQGAPLGQSKPAAELVEDIVSEATSIMGRIR